MSLALGIRQHVLRYWEEQFPMLSPIKRSGGRRYYRPEDVAVIVRIQRLVQQEGFTLRGARLALEGEASDGPRPAARTGERAGAPKPSLVDELKAIRADLAAALAQG